MTVTEWQKVWEQDCYILAQVNVWRHGSFGKLQC